MGYSFKLVRRPDQLAEVYAVRHQVYAVEKQWVPESTHGLEIDQWDTFSRHFAAVNGDGRVIGTARMVLDSPLGFPYESTDKLPEQLDRKTVCEVSRLAVLESDRGQRSLILIGLTRALWRVARTHGMTDWCAVVDQPVARLLKRLEFAFTYEGKPVYHLGSMSVPLVCSMETSRRALFMPHLDGLLADHIEEAYVEEDTAVSTQV